MLVRDLIEKLREFPQDLEICVRGYEGGYHKYRDVVDEPSAPEHDLPRLSYIQVDSYLGTDYYGDHEEIDDPKEAEEGSIVERVLIIY